jgi:nucleotide-binding universal stress UspA family protein
MKCLIATDGLLPARAAETLLARIGRRDLDITVMTVVPTLPPDVADRSGSIRDRMWQGAKKVVADASGRLQARGLQTRTVLAEGHSGEQIVQAVQRGGYELTILGAGTKNWLHHVLLGSTSTFVLHNSPSSVLIAHDVLPEGPKARILLGFDASEGAGLGLEAIVQFLDPARCSVKVLTIGDEPFPPIDFWPMPLGMRPSHVDAEATRVRRRHDAEGRARWAADEIRASGFEAASEADIGHAGVQLLKEAESGHFDLVVVGSRGLGPLRRTFLGSVSEQVVRHAGATLVARRVTA